MTDIRKVAVFFVVFISLFAFLHITMPDIKYADADGVAEIAMELTTGRVMYSKNSNAKLPMASTTKIMTALLVCEDCILDDVVEVPEEAVGTEGSSIYLKKGEKLTVRDLLYGLMLRSGNDAAVALSIIHSGSTQKFVERMNEKAREIGAVNTCFANPHGLPDSGHYTTASDLCNIARAAMSNEVFSEVVATTDYRGDYRNFSNKNKLLYSLEGANGVKTGYTEKAGRCLVSSAERNGMDVVCVVLNCYDMYERSSEIIDSCFSEYCLEELDGSLIFFNGSKPMSLGRDYALCVRKNEELHYEVIDMTGDADNVTAKLQISNANDLIFSENLYSII